MALVHGAVLLCLLVVFVRCEWSINGVERIQGSPYPATKLAETVWVLNVAGFSSSQKVLANSLSGIIGNQTFTSDFLYLLDSGAAYSLWLDQLKATHTEIYVDESLSNDMQGLLTKFAPMISGYTYSDATSASDTLRNAVSISAITNTVVITPETVSFAQAAGLSQLYNAGDFGTPDSLFSKYIASWSKSILSHQKDPQFLVDYSIFASAFNFYDPMLDTTLGQNALANMVPNSAVLGWGDDEYGMVSRATYQSKWVHAADYSMNLPLFTNMNLQTSKPKSQLYTPATESAHHTVTFIMSDGDNLQWLMNDFATSTKWWASPNRGEVPLGWTISPALVELAPLLLEYYQESSTEQDDLLTAASGIGYMYPDLWPESDLSGFASLNNAYMEKSQQSVYTIIGDTFNTATCSTLLANSSSIGIIWYDYSDYARVGGAVYFTENNQVMTGPRYILSSDFGLSPTEIASRINMASTDPTSPDAYSIVVVHCWTMTVDDVISTINQLDSDVIVRKPGDFLQDIVNNIPH
ncbi:protein phosphatase [Pelomyxa schiedti]|nr:protein phosphatase [Pelomyxa schiedti]